MDVFRDRIFSVFFNFGWIKRAGFLLNRACLKWLLPPVEAGERNRQALFWRLQGIGWGLSVVMGMAMPVSSELDSQDLLIMGTVRALLGIALTSFLLRPILRAMRRRAPMGISIMVLAVLCGLVAMMDIFLSKSLTPLLAQEPVPAIKFLDTSLAPRWIMYAIWCGLYCVIHYWFETQASQLRLARLETEIRTAELQRLRAQVNPHFLFNAFNSILAETDNPAAVAALTQGVSEYLRFSLRQPESGQSLGEELDALEHYLQVEKIRFEERLEYIISADEKARNCTVPGALVQPLVENALKYGSQTSPPPLRIHIDAHRNHNMLIITVSNTGKWVAPDPARFGGIGLSNLCHRLDLIFDKLAKFESYEESGQVHVRVSLPMGEKFRGRAVEGA